MFAGTLYLAVRPGMSGFERRFWGLFAAVSGIELASESHWTWWVVNVAPRGMPIGGWKSYSLFVVGLLILAVLVSMTRVGSQPFARWFAVYVDLILAGIVAWPMFFLLWTRPMMLASGGTVDDAAWFAGHTLIGAVILVADIAAVAGWKNSKWKSWERFVSAAFAFVGIGMVASPYWYIELLQRGRYEPSIVIDVLGVGTALMVLAVVYRLTTSSQGQVLSIAPFAVSVPRLVVRAYPGVIACALPIFMILAFDAQDTTSARSLEIATVLLAALLALRSWVLVIERSRVRRDALIDTVTGAWSDAFLERRLSDTLWFAKSFGREMSLIVFTVHELGLVADLHGQAQADGLLRRVADAIRVGMPHGAEVFRLGGQEFVVIALGVGSSEAAAHGRAVWLGLSHGSAGVGGSVVEFTIGVATFPSPVNEAHDLLAAAEIACRAARGTDDGSVVVFEESVAVVPTEHNASRVRLRTLRATVRALAEAVDARDPATRDHSVNVAELATALAQVLDLSDDRVQIVGLAALVHDVGKIAIRDDVLQKEGALEPAERTEFEEHSILGERILDPAGLDDIPSLVRWHHERYDGLGYPDQLSGERIPLESRILAVCDAFENMTAHRAFRTPVSSDEALAEIQGLAGSQFDPVVASAFVRMVKRLEHKRVKPHPEAS